MKIYVLITALMVMIITQSHCSLKERIKKASNKISNIKKDIEDGKTSSQVQQGNIDHDNSHDDIKDEKINPQFQQGSTNYDTCYNCKH